MVARMTPEVRIGDVWRFSDGVEQKITALDHPEDWNVPWPRVWMGDQHTGAPALRFATLVKRGAGKAWRPPQ